MTRQRLAELQRATAEELIARGESMLALGHQLLGQAVELDGKEFLTEVSLAAIPTVREANGNGHHEPEPKQEREEQREQGRSVGRFGEVTEKKALTCAQQLGQFTRSEYAEKLGLKPTAAGRWLTLFVGQEILDYRGGTYCCLMMPAMRDWIISRTESFSPEEAAKATGMTDAEAMTQLETFEDRGVIKQSGDNLFEYVLPDPKLNPREHATRMPPEKLPPCGVDSRATGEPVRVRAVDKVTRRQRSVSGAGGHKGAKAIDRRFEAAQAARAQRAEANKAKAQKQPKWQSRGKRKAA